MLGRYSFSLLSTSFQVNSGIIPRECFEKMPRHKIEVPQVKVTVQQYLIEKRGKKNGLLKNCFNSQEWQWSFVWDEVGGEQILKQTAGCGTNDKRLAKLIQEIKSNVNTSLRVHYGPMGATPPIYSH
ncbi:unnamed protein product, partial [Amoebophrya sp. A25]|eukprot:GSA25T00027561001.1